MDAILKLDNVSMYYHNGDTVVPGMTGITLAFARGEFVAVTGESGSGKSTLLNVISALAPYHEGEMTIFDKPTSAFDDADWESYRREHIGFVFQDYNLIESHSVLDNVVSAMMIRGFDEKSARLRAADYLERVGLLEYARRKAAKLSSGQKQRLAIARALAKETDIIVADEPTGNLDSDNGRQIVALLSELSRDRLVIMVSHNIEEAEAYATRRIRMHDGHVVADERLREPAPGQDAEPREQAARYDGKTLAKRLAALNLRAQPRRALLTLILMLVATAGSFIFFGVFLANTDDTPAKVYDNSAFRNGDMERIVLRRADGANVSDADVTALLTIPHVEQAEKFDHIADVNYFCDYDTDYYYKYTTVSFTEGAETLAVNNSRSVLLLNESKFMRSASCLYNTPLLAGRLPEASNEVVLSSSDASLVGTKKVFIFSDRPIWSVQFFEMEMTVTGVTGTDAEQVYFSEKLALELTANGGDNYTYLKARKMLHTGNTQKIEFAPILMTDASLGENELMLSTSAADPKLLQTYEELATLAVLMKDGEYNFIENVDVAGLHDSSYLVVTVSDALFNSLFVGLASEQLSLYIEDYAYTDDVISAASAMGYRCVSPFRMGSLHYDAEKVNARMTTLLICIAAFVAVYALEILLVSALFRFRRADYAVLRSMGMELTVMRSMVKRELFTSALVAMLITATAAYVLWNLDIERIYDVMKYLRWYHFLIVAALDLLCVWLLSIKSTRYLERELSGRGRRITINGEASA